MKEVKKKKGEGREVKEKGKNAVEGISSYQKETNWLTGRPCNPVRGDDA